MALERLPGGEVSRGSPEFSEQALAFARHDDADSHVGFSDIMSRFHTDIKVLIGMRTAG
jgi:hypothetical protein